MGRAGGPVRSRDVLAELAGVVPAFAVADGGVLPEFGVLLAAEGPDSSPAPVGAGVGGRFDDPWQVARGHKGDRMGEPTSKGGKNA